MKKPTIDRKNSWKDYTFKNCRYIEHELNSRLQSPGKDVRIKSSETLKKLWKNKDYRERRIKQIKEQNKNRKRGKDGRFLEEI